MYTRRMRTVCRSSQRGAGDEKGRTRGPGLTMCSPDWTRTSNLPVNSRLLCQLSYGGSLRTPNTNRPSNGF